MGGREQPSASHWRARAVSRATERREPERGGQRSVGCSSGAAEARGAEAMASGAARSAREARGVVGGGRGCTVREHECGPRGPFRGARVEARMAVVARRESWRALPTLLRHAVARARSRFGRGGQGGERRRSRTYSRWYTMGARTAIWGGRGTRDAADALKRYIYGRVGRGATYIVEYTRGYLTVLHTILC